MSEGATGVMAVRPHLLVVFNVWNPGDVKTRNRKEPPKDHWKRVNALAVILMGAFLFVLLLITVAQWRSAS